MREVLITAKVEERVGGNEIKHSGLYLVVVNASHYSLTREYFNRRIGESPGRRCETSSE
jgi:hypothetical protein